MLKELFSFWLWEHFVNFIMDLLPQTPSASLFCLFLKMVFKGPEAEMSNFLYVVQWFGGFEAEILFFGFALILEGLRLESLI